MIRLTDPTRIGPALGEIRQLLGISRRSVSRTLAAKTGRSETSVNSQLWGWENDVHAPDLASIPLLLDALGYDLALIPREDDPSGRADPLCVWPDGVCTCGEPEGHQGREDA